MACSRHCTSDCGRNHFEGCLVWVQLFLGGSTAHPGGPADLALVKKQLYSTFSPRETQINSF